MRRILAVLYTLVYAHETRLPLHAFLLQFTSSFQVLINNFGCPVMSHAKTAGYVPDRQRRAFRFNTTLAGNSNAGHDYGTELTNAQRWDLLEFLKTL